MECVVCVCHGAAWVPVGTGGVLDVCLFRLRRCGWCRRGVSRVGLDLEGWWYICVSCESRFFVYMAGPGICILCWADTCVS